jgi:hypothetical protein
MTNPPPKSTSTLTAPKTTVKFIAELPSVTKTTDFHHGYIILKEIDIEPYWDDPEHDHYKCRIFSTEGKLLLTYPSMPHAMLNCRDAFNEQCGAITAAAVDNGRISFQQNASRRRANHLLLDFPTGHILSSSEVYADAGEDEELPMEMIAVTYHHPAMGVIQGTSGTIEVTNTCYYAAWVVARTDIKPNKKGAFEGEKKKQKMSKGAQMAALLAGKKGKVTDVKMEG